jgi:hypothetical protein
VLYRKVFQPVKREVEGRKDHEKRLSDRKKASAGCYLLFVGGRGVNPDQAHRPVYV